MKELKRIKLHSLERNVLSECEEDMIRGGASCLCSGTSSSAWNDVYNFEYGYDAIGGGQASCGCGINTVGYNESAFWHG